jgi:cytidine deaminase
VASAVIADDGNIYAGVNVENASYGGTVCAERVAIFSAIANGAKKINSILVYTNENDPWPPCGLCRQVIAEFMDPKSKVYLANEKGIQSETDFEKIFPQAFTGSQLTKQK